MEIKKGIFKLYNTCYQFSVNLIVLTICVTDFGTWRKCEN